MSDLQVEILVGLPGSGKSTYALEKVTNDGSWVRVNKDSLRQMMHNSKSSKTKEEFILKVRDAIILTALDTCKNVIVYDTNFDPKHIHHIKGLVQNRAVVIVNDSFLSVPLEECIKRDLQRPNSVGKNVIVQMHRQFVQKNPPY